MTAPFFTGDTVPLKFLVTDKDGAVNPSSCVLRILKPNNDTGSAEVAIDGNEVSCNIPGSITDRRGRYKAYFVLTLSYGERTHKMEFNVICNPEVNK